MSTTTETCPTCGSTDPDVRPLGILPEYGEKDIPCPNGWHSEPFDFDRYVLNRMRTAGLGPNLLEHLEHVLRIGAMEAAMAPKSEPDPEFAPNRKQWIGDLVELIAQGAEELITDMLEGLPT